MLFYKQQDLAQLIEEQKQVSTKYSGLFKLRQEKLAADSDVDKLQKQVQALAEELETTKTALPAAKEAFDVARLMWERVQAIDLEEPETYQEFADLADKVQAWKEFQETLAESREHLDQATEAKQKSAIALEQATQLHRQKVKALQAVLMEECYDQIQPSVELEVKDQEQAKDQAKDQAKETHKPAQGPVGDEKTVQPEQPSKEANKPSQEQAKDQAKETHKPAQGPAQSRPADKDSLVPANQQAAVLPQTGESDPSLIYGMAALSILTGLGLVNPRFKRQ